MTVPLLQHAEAASFETKAVLTAVRACTLLAFRFWRVDFRADARG
jgi:hypothetical protein